MDGAKLLYSKFAAKAQQSHYCPLCQRGYQDDKDLESFVGTVSLQYIYIHMMIAILTLLFFSLSLAYWYAWAHSIEKG